MELCIWKVLWNCVLVFTAVTNAQEIVVKQQSRWNDMSNLMPNRELAFQANNFDVSNIFSAECTASFPIHWVISGFLSGLSALKLLPIQRDLGVGTFRITFNTTGFDYYSQAFYYASLKIACESVVEPDQKIVIFLFVPRGWPQIKSTHENTKLLPCLDLDPSTEQMQLFKILPSGKEEPLTGPSVGYDPTEGFTSINGFWNGHFTCKKGNYKWNVTATVTRPDGDLIFIPKSSKLFALAESPVLLSCTSKTNRNLSLLVSNITNVWLTDPPGRGTRNTYETFHIVNRSTAMGYSVEVHSPELEYGYLELSIACIESTVRTISTLRNWTIEFVKTPVLEADNYERKLSCLSDRIDDMSIRTIHCSNHMDCNFRRRCLNVGGTCDPSTIIVSSFKASCWDNILKVFVRCVTLPYSHLTGIVQCRVRNETKNWEFFHSLNLIKYTSWENVPTEELLRLDDVPSVLYTNQTFTFTCQCVSFLFADSITFELEYKNGSRTLLNEDVTGLLQFNFSRPGAENPRRIETLNYLGIVSIFLPLEANGMHCLAPWGNTSDVMRTQKVFTTRHLLHPYFTESHNTGFLTFTIEERNARIKCPASGEPLPVYHWLVDGKTVLDIYPESKTSIGSDGEGYLEFPSIHKNYSGEFVCIASNFVGNISRTTTVRVSESKEKPETTLTAIYISAISIPLVIITIFTIVLIICMKRYQRSQKLLRELTDAELDEFFAGRPELLGEGHDFAATATTDLIPYQNEYEIDQDDIVFGAILGQGHFSIVLKGKITSGGIDVALKIPKSGADIELFKTLLSEVKILMFVGNHVNLAKLVGVCTTEIRNRSITIAMELCELGSLDKVLQTSRSTFINLMNENQVIDRQLLDSNALPNDIQLSTLDLIRFAMEISNGMVYLSSINVIHSDLAARNILLSSDKTVKISDFGLSRNLYQQNNYVKKSSCPLPWRWMAVESLMTMTFSIKSDVWSYGVTLYEIFSLGSVPFPSEEWSEDFISRLSNGMRMGRPEFCTPNIFSKIGACWEKLPEHRPDFSSLYEFFITSINNICLA